MSDGHFLRLGPKDFSGSFSDGWVVAVEEFPDGFIPACFRGQCAGFQGFQQLQAAGVAASHGVDSQLLIFGRESGVVIDQCGGGGGVLNIAQRADGAHLQFGMDVGIQPWLDS